MTEPFNWGALFAMLPEAIADIKANKPLPPGQPMSMTDAAAALKAAQPYVDAANALVIAHPGAVTAAIRVLGALGAIGVPCADEAEAVVSSVPGALAFASKSLPDAAAALAMFAPAPSWEPGPGLFRGR